MYRLRNILSPPCKGRAIVKVYLRAHRLTQSEEIKHLNAQIKRSVAQFGKASKELRDKCLEASEAMRRFGRVMHKAMPRLSKGWRKHIRKEKARERR